jgi:GntR family transcriptional repressor for pyruvate dehydrogenase complex
MNPIRPTLNRIADVVARDLEQRILEGSLKPGDRLPSERTLALEFSISRPSLREAIQKLVHKGLLETRHGGGTVVTNRLQASFSDPWQNMLQEHPLLQADMLEFRHMLEGEAAKLAA